ncbi:MAG: hypothetical protein SFY69_03470 [Planctomycetota bacterium]|nr:hypothetical protein [Planctomycetota bacterium]
MITRPRPSRAFARAIGLGLLAASAAGAHAQESPPAEITRVRLGWGGAIIPGERWAPVVVDVRGGPDAFAGTLTIEYTQDATQRAQVWVPVATTPNQTVPYELGVCVPFHTDSVRVTLTGERFRQQIDFDRSGAAGSQPLPSIDGAERFVLAVGDDLAALRLADAGVGTPVPPAGMPVMPASTPPDPWSRTTVVPAGAADLPMSWMLYEGLSLVVARERDLLDADRRSRDALLTWVEAGGRLIVLLEPAGDAWRTFVGAGHVEVGGAVPVTLEQGSIANDAASGGADAGIRTARPITITPAGLAQGWRTLWPFEGGGPTRGLGATGPVGMGMVGLLGIDPARLHPTLDTSRTRSHWRDVCAQVLPSHSNYGDSSQPWAWFGSGRSGPDTPSADAMSAGLDALAIVPPFGSGAFVVVGLSIALLGLMLGPVDYALLRRRRRARWNWLTAITWIGLAGGTAYLAPVLVRSGETVNARMRAVDLIDGPEGGAFAWETALTGVFAGQPLLTAPPTIDGRPACEGSWFRGVSPVYQHGGPATGFPPLRIGVRSTPTRGGIPGPMSQGQWTYRTLLEQRPGMPASLPMPVRVARTKAGYAVEVGPLPEGAALRSAHLVTDAGHASLHLVPAEDERGGRVLVDNVRANTLVVSPSARAAEWERDTPTRTVWPAGSTWPGTCLDLPLVRDRTDAIDRRLARGWVCVMLEAHDMPDDGLLDVPGSRPRTVMLLRAVLRPDAPLDGDLP